MQPSAQAGQSLWWRWTAPAAGQVGLDTLGSGYDTRLDVYTCASLGALAAVAGNDNAEPTGTRSALRFQPVTGGSYRFAITSNNGSAGNANLAWSLNTAALANLSVSLVGPESAQPGSVLNYTLTASNAGPQAATRVVASVVLPPGISTVALPAGCSSAGATLTCQLGELASGASIALSVTLHIDALTAPVRLSASLSSDLPDPVTGNNTGSAQLALGGDGDIPILPDWALLLLGAGLLMQLRPTGPRRP